jgi:signal transduction histidine kinase
MATERQKIDAASRRVYERLRRVQLRARLRFLASIGVPIVILGGLADLVYVNDRMPERLAGYVFLAAVQLTVLRLTRFRSVLRHATALALVQLVGVSGGLIYLVSLSAADPSLLAAPIGALLMAAPLLLPLGALPQLGLSGIVVATYGALAWQRSHPATPEQAYSLAAALVSTLVVSVIVAGLLEDHRRIAFRERRRVRALAIQRRRLIDIGRELRSTLELDALQPRLVAHALRVVPANSAAIVRREADGLDYRVVALAGDSPLESLLELQLPPDFTRAFLAAFGPRDVQVCPGSPIDSLMLGLMRAYDVRYRMIAAVGPLPAPLALLSWDRRGAQPFTDAERLAAQAMADQAFTALSAAHLYGKALEASRLKSQFVSTVSHEFRTPLSVIMGYAEMARDLDLTADERETSLRGIEGSARELLLLVEHTLDIARFEAGRSPVQLEPIRLATFWGAIEEMCALLPRPVPGVRLEWTDKPPDVAISSDRRRIGIIVRNLVGNALKFTERGSVTVAATLEGEQLRIRVIDTGIGIRAEDQGAIFEIFRQADGSETRRFPGTGLGLFIVRQFVEQLGGSISVESAYGAGSTFSVVLPVTREPLSEGIRQHRLLAAARLPESQAGPVAQVFAPARLRQ